MVRSPARDKIYFIQSALTSYWTHRPFLFFYVYRGIKRPVHVADLWPPTSVEVKNDWRYTYSVHTSSWPAQWQLYLTSYSGQNMRLRVVSALRPEVGEERTKSVRMNYSKSLDQGLQHPFAGSRQEICSEMCVLFWIPLEGPGSVTKVILVV